MIGPKKTDHSQIQDSGHACVGCGRGPKDGVMLMRLRTYSRSLCCGACFVNPEYAKCANKNPAGTKCGHEPMVHRDKRGACTMAGCGCTRWIHGLENEFDRQLAAGVGKSPRVEFCRGFGVNLDKCGRMILAKPDGTILRLCDKCERRWVQEVSQGLKEAATLLDMDVTKVMPQ